MKIINLDEDNKKGLRVQDDDTTTLSSKVVQPSPITFTKTIQEPIKIERTIPLELIKLDEDIKKALKNEQHFNFDDIKPTHQGTFNTSMAEGL